MKKLIVLLIILLGGIGFFVYQYFFQEDKIYVPDFTNKTQQDVITWCNSLESNPCIFESDYSDTIEEGNVIYQSISADEELTDNISFIISLGKKVEITTPNIDENTTKDTIEVWVSKNNITNPIEYVEEFSDKIVKDNVIRIEPKTINNSETKIKVIISKGPEKKKENKNEDDLIEVVAKDYIDITVEEFEEIAKKLNLKPNHNSDRDDYSETIEKGKIVWHGSGLYEKDETFNYGLSLGENDKETYYVSYGDYKDKTEAEFKEAVTKLTTNGLIPLHDESKDEYSNTIAKGNICWHGCGEYEDKEQIKYGLSLGKDEKDDSPVTLTSGQYVGLSLTEFNAKMAELGLKPEHSKEHSDAYSDKYEKDSIIWHGSGTWDIKNGDDVIHYTVSLGKKESESGSKTVHIDSGAYVGKTYAEFESAVKALGITPRYRKEWDAYSDTIAKGSIIKNGTGDYEVNNPNDPISYGLSLGPSVKVTVENYAGKTETAFKNYINGINVNLGTRSTSYSDTVAEGLIISNDYGSKEENSYINYTVSLGVKPIETAKIMLAKYYAVGNTYQETVNMFKTSFAKFEDVTYRKSEKSDKKAGIVENIYVNGSSSYSAGDYPLDTAIIVVIYDE